eukprot:g3293.t1
MLCETLEISFANSNSNDRDPSLCSMAKHVVHSVSQDEAHETGLHSSQTLVERSYPFLTAIIAIACIASNAVIILGVDAQAGAVETLGATVSSAVQVGINSAYTMENKTGMLNGSAVDVLQQAGRELRQTRAALLQVREDALLYSEGYDSATADEQKAKMSLMVTALSKFEVQYVAPVDALVGGFAGAASQNRAVQGALDSLSLESRQLNTLKYITEQLGNIQDILRAGFAMSDLHCESQHAGSDAADGNCTSTAPAALLAVDSVLTAVRDILDTLLGLADWVSLANSGLRALLPAPSTRNATVEQYLSQISAALAPPPAPAPATTSNTFARVANTTFVKLVDAQVRVMDQAVADEAARLAFVDEKAREATAGLQSLRSALLRVQVSVQSSAPNIAELLRKVSVGVATYGIVVASLVFIYALSLQQAFFASLDVNKLGQGCLRTASYLLVFVLVDVFVIVAFAAMLSLAALAGLEALLVGACWDDFNTAASGSCESIDGELVGSLVLSVGGGITNFLLSYHLLAALQAAFSKYVQGGYGLARSEGVHLDYNRDGHANSIGFDTTGDGLIDTVVQKKTSNAQGLARTKAPSPAQSGQSVAALGSVKHVV